MAAIARSGCVLARATLLALALLAWSAAKVVVVPEQVDGCAGLPPGSEACYYRLIYNDFSCTERKPCSKLLAYFGGGEESVKDGVYDHLMKYWTRQGYLTVVAQTFNTSGEAGVYPYFEEYDRQTYIIEQTRAFYSNLWTGEYFAVGGVSHGATAPPAAIANRDAFNTNAAVWTGAVQTAVVLFDGISNPATYEEWLGTFTVLNGTTCWGQHSRMVSRYSQAYPLEHSCRNRKCYCSDPESAPVWANDTLPVACTYPPSPYTCADYAQTGTGATDVLWFFTSCQGELLSPCDAFGDFVPTDQQTAFYDSIANCSGVIAKHVALPNCGHSACGTSVCGASDAVDWLATFWPDD